MADTTVGSIKIQAILDSKPAQRGLALLDKRLKGLKKPVNNVNKIFGRLFKVAGFAGFTKMAIDAGKFGRAMGLLADKTGIAASKISSMRNSFAAMGGSAKSIDNLLNNLSTGLARLSMGDGTLASTLSAMNISAWDENGRLKKSDRLQGEIANWANQQKALGRSFADVAVFLKDNFNIEEDLAKQMYDLGHGGMEKQRREIEKRTGRLSQESIDRLRELNQKWAEFTVTLQVTFQNIVAQLAPFMEIVLDFAQKIGKFLGDNPELGALGAAILAISSSFGVLGTALKGVGAILTTLLAHPLIAMAIAGGYIGKKIGDSDIANRILNDMLGPKDLSAKKQAEMVRDAVLKGQMSPQQAGIALSQLGTGPLEMAQSGYIEDLRNQLKNKKISFEEFTQKLNELKPVQYEIIYVEGGLEKAETVDYEQPVAPVYMEQTITVNKDGTVNTETASSGDINFLTDKLILNEEGGAL